MVGRLARPILRMKTHTRFDRKLVCGFVSTTRLTGLFCSLISRLARPMPQYSEALTLGRVFDSLFGSATRKRMPIFLRTVGGAFLQTTDHPEYCPGLVGMPKCLRHPIYHVDFHRTSAHLRIYLQYMRPLSLLLWGSCLTGMSVGRRCLSEHRVGLYFSVSDGGGNL